jgi:hypothetical protein
MLDTDSVRVAKLAMERAGRMVQKVQSEVVSEVVVSYADGAPGTLPAPTKKDIEE